MKKCPMCSEEVQDDAIKCKHCKSDIKTGDSPQEKKKKGSFLKIILLAFAVLIAFPLIIAFMRDDSNTAPSMPDNAQAVVISRNYVQSKHLDYPDSAEWPGMLDQDFVVNANGNEYTVRHWVLASNAYGVKKKTWYTIKMKYNGGNWADPNNWTELGFNFN